MTTFAERKIEYGKSISNSNSFVEIMGSLDNTLRSWVVKDLMDLTKTAYWTIDYGWGSGRSKPDNLKQSLLAEYFDSTPEVLFPKD